MISSQMLKGMLEGCVLKIIAEHETYGMKFRRNLSHMALEIYQKEPFIRCCFGCQQRFYTG